MGLAVAYLNEGAISYWAFFNRGFGWFVLMGYVFFAGWIVSCLEEKWLLPFIRLFLAFLFGTIILGTLWFLFFQIGIHERSQEREYYQLSGLLGNRNAFAFLACTAFVIYTYCDLQKIKIIPKGQSYLTHIIWFMLPLALMFAGGRAGWILGLIIVVWFSATQWRYSVQYILPGVVLSTVIIASLFSYNSKIVLRERQDSKISNMAVGEVVAPSDQRRITGAKDALELWSQHKVLGSGIGGFIIYQQEKHGKLLDHIDNSALWILTELGLVGILAFGGFYIVTFIALRRKYRNSAGIHKSLAQAMMVIMVLFALYSLVHQIMYARYLWLLLGLALAVPRESDVNNK